MPIAVHKIRIPVEDQERAKEFWIQKVGCRVVQDETYDGSRWLEVQLPDGVTLILEQGDGEPIAVAAGQPNTPVFFGCEDVDETFRDLSQRDVRFVQEPIDMPFGRWALFEDTEGNLFPLMGTAMDHG